MQVHYLSLANLISINELMFYSLYNLPILHPAVYERIKQKI